ncbi:MAG: DegT/DnrJ/EryC1/StrS aminotransferase family protein [Candidatus Staskawiczbacteria bacterium]|nr:DegT/DnrJ/EryC1/StrS aminotransferase family protein [Candidatus Staskawiczbacteria bacterium]
MKIPLNRPTITKKDADFLKRSGGNLFRGEPVKRFEEKFAGYIGRKYALAVNSGTAALHLALLSLRIGEKDEIILPSYTCVALLNAINYVKAKPKLTDCNFDVKKGDFNISYSDVKAKISSKTKAIIVPHMFGLPAEIDKIISFKIPVIEDATQSLGGDYLGKKSGSFGEISIFSLHHSKMATTGAGGMLLTDSKELIDRARFLADYEFNVIKQRLAEVLNYNVQYNYKMAGLNAVLGLSQLNQLDEFVKRRKKLAKIYAGRLKKTAENSLPFRENIFWRYIVKTEKNPKDIIKKALKYGIELGRGVYPPLHRYLRIDDKLFPNTGKAVDSLIALPIYPSLEDKEINYLLGIIEKII